MKDNMILQEVLRFGLTRRNYWAYPPAVRATLDEFEGQDLFYQDGNAYVLDEKKIENRLNPRPRRRR